MSNQPNWTDVESTGKPEYYVDYLDTVTAQSEMQRYKRKTYQLVGAYSGRQLLDVGCGTGDDVLALAELVGPGGRVVGIDRSAGLIEEARGRLLGRRLPAEFLTGDVHDLPFPDASFDGVRADRVFMHLPDPARALAEMVRVVRPGGRVVIREPDWDTLAVDAPDPALTRQIFHQHFDRGIRHPTIGRQLYRLCKEAGLDAVEVADTSTLVLTDFATANALYGIAPAAQAARADDWLGQIEQWAAQGRFFSAVTGFTVVGSKPEAA